MHIKIYENRLIVVVLTAFEGLYRVSCRIFCKWKTMLSYETRVELKNINQSKREIGAQLMTFKTLHCVFKNIANNDVS